MHCGPLVYFETLILKNFPQYESYFTLVTKTCSPRILASRAQVCDLDSKKRVHGKQQNPLGMMVVGGSGS
jgi:hypothetical protein